MDLDENSTVPVYWHVEKDLGCGRFDKLHVNTFKFELEPIIILLFHLSMHFLKLKTRVSRPGMIIQHQTWL